MDFNDLTPEQIEAAKACTTSEELVAFAKKEGLELTEDQLDAISGGGDWQDFAGKFQCPMFTSM